MASQQTATGGGAIMAERRATTPDGIRAMVAELGPTIIARAPEIEAARRVPLDLLDDLIGIGCFRLLLPRDHGGVGSDLQQAMSVFEALADASVGWTVMIGAGSWCDLAGLPRAAFDELFPGDRDVIVAGAFDPSAASITPDNDGYEVVGRWGFASGCEHATLLYGNCIEDVVDGHPHLRVAVFAPEEIVIEDTWKTSGLRGTGSHHFHAERVRVPADRTFVPLLGEPCLDETLLHVPTPALFSISIASIALGIAQGALDDIVAIAADKVPLLADGALAADPLFQFELAAADTSLSTARALLYEVAESAWATAAAREPFTLLQRARLRAAAVWATERAAMVVDTAYRSGGGTSVYDGCPLQRRLRDVHAVTQHFLVKRETLTTAGAILAGQDVQPAVF